ncbi:exonuclease subunit SbcD [Colwellia sp. 20A7]|uniref:exonuclease subunit SbcD n=1 Tax=Colwellia sp. 20A7 TaxID=2689569 RepID=UPI001356FA05|nr:exonuclease subunit SbcD [Colwellia sp. 20A7]
MRIIHTSDWHLGQFFYGKSRANEHQQFLDWLLTKVEDNAVDAIIVAGDIFDTATPPSYARQMYFNFISKLQRFNCQLVVLAGNHDSVSMLAESKELLSALSTKVIANVTDTSISANLADQVFAIKNKQGIVQAVICAIPFIRPRDVIKSQAGQSATDKSKQLQQAIVEHYQRLFEQAQLLVAQHEKSANGIKLPIIATGHLTALGVTTSDSVRDIYIGTLEAFPSNAFPAADYIALGHIHRAQKVGKTEHIRYCGSPIALSFDEAKQKKRVLLVGFDENKLSTVTDLIIPTFQPLAMLKTTLDTLNQDLETLVSTLISDDNDSKLWLDIELANTGLLSDLQPKITALVKDFPVEVLLVRRQKQVRQRLLLEKQQDHSTLNELTLDEVFDSRLQQEAWLDDDTMDSESIDSKLIETELNNAKLTRKEQLQTLFKQTVAQVLSEGE